VGFGAPLIPVEFRGAVRVILAKILASLGALSAEGPLFRKAATPPLAGIKAAIFSISEKNASHMYAEAVF
jgi:hypothetical protein